MAKSIASGLGYVRAMQADDGHFDSFSSSTKQPFEPILTYQTTFTSSLMLHSLAGSTEAQDIRNKLSDWLLTQKNDAWSFNYWGTHAPERKTLPYPDDLDDTFCALAALYKHNPQLIDAQALGKIVRLLLATETTVGGPYRTWLVTADAPAVWQDVDLAVNSNVAYFLRLAAQPLPNLTTLMTEHIKSGRLLSAYYPSIYPLFYYLARSYDGDAASLLITQLRRRRRSGYWGTPQQTALAMSALCELKAPDDLRPAIDYLLEQQLPDGHWPAEAFCIDPAKTGRQYYNGCAALTSSFIIEALKHTIAKNKSTPRLSIPHKEHKSAQIHAAVLAKARMQYKRLGPTLRTYMTSTLERMVQGDHSREIVLLPYFFAQALRSGTPSQALLTNLGLANLYGWAAYTIFDDFLDGDGKPQLLPVATSALRYSLEQFQIALPLSPEYQTFVRQTFHTIDNANAWEIRYCRFNLDEGQYIQIGALPNYDRLQRLAERSLGHALTPLGILSSLGIMPNDPAAQRLVLSLKQYLIARQLHDDLLDWEKDVRAGHCSFVVQQLLHILQVTPGRYDLFELVPRMQQAFWGQVLPDVGAILLRHTMLAKQNLARSKLFTPANEVTKLIDNLHTSVSRELAEHGDAQRFLRAYRES
ncbi:MAG TPA: hypothetical protein VLH38_04595 [Patescibacteria group bacterium]|nr:hypothetical protein [Patescibacteria group bacterium]